MRNLLITGGPYHPFERTSRLLSELLDGEGVRSDITEDVEGGLAGLGSYDLLTLNLLRWRMIGDRFDDDRERWALTLSEAARTAVAVHLARGRGILALHTAAICFDDWPGWEEILGARWNWTRSSHNAEPRLSSVHAVSAHPIVDGVPPFELVDEIYSSLDRGEVVPLLASPRRGEQQPVLWAHQPAGGRLVYDALGHDERSVGHPTHAAIIKRAVGWILGR